MKNFYDFKVDNIKGLSAQEKEFRNKELDLFSKNGFPNKEKRRGNLLILIQYLVKTLPISPMIISH